MADITYKLNPPTVDWAQLKMRLQDDNFDNGRSVEQYRISFENTAWVCIAYDGNDIVGTVRALSDGICNAYIVDVWTYTPYRNQGIARHMMETTLQQLQGQHVYLFTDDAVGLYEKLGFAPQDVGMGRVAGQ